jgi:hypothetical protein
MRASKQPGSQEAASRQQASQRRRGAHQAWETDSEEEDEAAAQQAAPQPAFSGVSSARLVAALNTQLETLGISVGDFVAVVAGNHDDDDMCWLLRASGPPKQLAEPLAVGDLTFEAGEYVGEGTWLERVRDRNAFPHDYLMGEPCAAYTNLVICTDVEVHTLGEGVYTLSMHEDERICAARQAMALSLPDA